MPPNRFPHTSGTFEPALTLTGQPLSEEASFREHCDALEATVFAGKNPRPEVVLELDAGQLRLRNPR